MKRLPLTFFVLALLGALATASVLYTLQRTSASDHQDSPLTVSRPGADITDVFVFPAEDPNNVVLAMDVHPLIPRAESGGIAFDPAVMYQFKIDTTGDFREDRVIQFRASGTGSAQHIEVYGPAAPANAGTVSEWTGSPQTVAFNTPATLSNGVRVFAGPRREPFYFDLAQFYKIIPDRNYKNQPHPPAPSANCFRKPGVDFFREYNVLSLVAEVPRRVLAKPDGMPGLVHVYATTSLASGSGGSYEQVERLGRPGVKEVFEAFADHDRSNRSAPWNDPTLSHSIRTFMSSAPPNGAGRSAQLAVAVDRVLMPDEIAADLGAGGPAGYLAVETKGKSALPTAVVRTVPEAGLKGLKKSIANKSREFGGRDPSSPIVDISLGVVFGSLGQKVGLADDDNKETACLTSDNVTAESRGVTKSFPYLGNPI